MNDNRIYLFVPGSPQALKRHQTRVVKYKGDKTDKRGRDFFTIEYDPSKESKKDFLATVINNRPGKPWDGPVLMSMVMVFPRPKNHYTSKGLLKKTAPIFKTSKPDMDNVDKFVKDALKGVFYVDDSQVCKKDTYMKIYEIDGVPPGLHVLLVRIDDDANTSGGIRDTMIRLTIRAMME